MGLARYYRKFVPNYSNKAKPLNELLQNDMLFEWTTAGKDAFDALKETLTSSPVLRPPDLKRPLELHTYWAMTGIGTVVRGTTTIMNM